MNTPLRSLLGLFASLAVSSATAAEGWKLVWSDEFNQVDGSAPASTNWMYDVGGKGWGNGELECYTDRRENSRIENGCLVIEARKEAFTGKDGVARDYTSARIKTKGKQEWTYGRIEARMKLPKGQGIWPAFWMLGEGGWPACGEIDIMENIGKEPATVHGTIHGPGYSGGKGIGKPFKLPSGKAVADDFHIYAIEWQTNRISWFMDEHQYFTVTPASLPPNQKWVFDKREFILLNVAVGGHWPGSPDATTQFPQKMLVDYVRVYSRTNAP